MIHLLIRKTIYCTGKPKASESPRASRHNIKRNGLIFIRQIVSTYDENFQKDCFQENIKFQYLLTLLQ